MGWLVGSLREAWLPALGGALAIALMIAGAHAVGEPLVAIPFTTSIVLLMGAPASEPAQPRNVIGGHVVSALAGLAMQTAFGAELWGAAPAVGLAIALMKLTRTFHPPAGINAFIIVTQHLPWSFVLMPVAIGAVLLVVFARAFHTLAGPLRG